MSNRRKDDYGKNLKDRCKLLLEIAKEIRKIWPKEKILGARVTGSDWLKKGTTISDCIFLCKNLKKLGLITFVFPVRYCTKLKLNLKRIPSTFSSRN